MIKNQRQLATASERLEQLEKALAEISDPDEGAPLQDLARDIREEIEEYERLVANEHTQFMIHELDDLGEVLVQARLARGLTHAQLADRLDVAESQVQRWEARCYEQTKLWRMAEILEVLDFRLRAKIVPTEALLLPAIGASYGRLPTSTGNILDQTDLHGLGVAEGDESSGAPLHPFRVVQG